MPHALTAVAAEADFENASTDDQWLPVGKVVGAQGLRGELRINPASDFPERFTKPGPRWLQLKSEAPREIVLTSGRQLPGKSLFIVRFKGIENRSDAEALVGQTLLVSSNDRPKLQEGEFHLLDLVGLEARLNVNGNDGVGTVTDLISGGNDLLEITRPDGHKLLIPFVEAIVPEVHQKEGWLLITPPPGLLEL